MAEENFPLINLNTTRPSSFYGRWLCVISILTITACSPQENSLSTQLQTTESKFSYALGEQIAENYRKQGIMIDSDSFVQGLLDELENNPAGITDQEIERSYRNLETLISDHKTTVAARNLQPGREFLVSNRKRPEVFTTSSGLQYEIINENTGARADADKDAVIDYQANLIDGTEVDFSFGMPRPITVSLAGSLIPGLTEGILMMAVGEIYKFYIPTDLAYGEEGTDTIPGNSVLIIQVKLISLISENEPTS
ncbi:MAG: FKBP-type peptidyl-prolyl cis-trans isomerase N-terminal domain-containing protein [Verrucomicrobiota bacterium]